MLNCLFVTAFLSLLVVLPPLIFPKIVSKYYLPVFVIVHLILCVLYVMIGFKVQIPFLN